MNYLQKVEEKFEVTLRKKYLQNFGYFAEISGKLGIFKILFLDGRIIPACERSLSSEIS